MTKNELYEEVEQKSEAYIDSINVYGDVGLSRNGGKNAYKQGALDFAEPREKRIEELANQLEDTEKELADYHIKYLFFKKLSKENAELKNENDKLKAQLERAKVYLKAISDLLQKQNESHYVLNLLETTVFYDEADCDGYCLKNEIDTFLETGV